MVANSTFPQSATITPRRGFFNLLGKEMRAWWGTYRWIIQALIWAIVVNGTLAFVLFGMPVLLEQTSPADAESFDAVVQGVQALFQIGSVALAIGAILLAQDQILGERERGVTEWILSKPVSRVAYVLSKLAADSIGVVVILVGLQSAIAYALISLASGGSLAPASFLIGAGGLALHTLFYLGLTLMMGVLARSRTVLLGVPLGVLLGGMLLVNMLGKVALFTPWSFASVLPATVLQMPLPLSIGVPLVSTAAWTLLSIAVALWKFKRLEF